MVPPIVARRPPAKWLAGRSHDGNHGAVLSKVSYYCGLLRGVVEVNAHDKVEVPTCAKMPPDSDGAGPALPTAYLHDVDAIVRVVVGGGEVGEEVHEARECVRLSSR